MNNKTLRNLSTTIILIAISIFALLLASCSQSTPPSAVTPAPEKEDTTPKPEEDKQEEESKEEEEDTVVTTPDTKYNITINFVDQSITPSQKQVFLAAANIWQQVITADLRDVQANIPAGSCGSADPGFSGTIDDIVILASAPNIDGPKGILGQAGPCGVRSSNPDRGLPYYGIMAFDAADIATYEAEGKLENLILHEMGHVLGIGTLWDNFAVISGAGSDNPTFTGTHALNEWHALGGSGNVPVEDQGGAGTRDGHWRESIFNTELMTGFSDPVQQLSRLTIASLKDLTYSVNFSAADSYVLPPAPSSLETLSHEDHSHSTPTTTRFGE